MRARLYLVYLNPPDARGNTSEKRGIRAGIIEGFTAGIDEVIFSDVTGAESGRGCALGRGSVQGGVFYHPQNPLRLSLNTHTYTELIMSTKTISITEEAYERLKNLKKDEKTSFSDVIIAHYPKRKKLSDVLKEIGANPELADSIETVSREMRKARLREVRF